MSGRKPKVSIVITNYNGMKILPSCLSSIEKQTYRDFEVILADDASSDGSPQVAKKNFPWIHKVVINAKNTGPAKLKNIGIEYSEGEYIAFLDNDVALEPRWLEIMVDRMEKEDENCAVLASKLLFENNRKFLNSTGGIGNFGGYSWDRFIFYLDEDIAEPQENILFACSAAMLLKKSVLKQSGPFDPTFIYPYEDADFGWRLNIMGYSVKYVPEVAAYHRMSATLGTNTVRRVYFRERNRIKNLINNLSTDSIKLLWKDLIYEYRYIIRSTVFENKDNLSMRIKLLLALMAVPLNHVYNARKFLKFRKEIQGKRRIEDTALMRDGLLQNTIRIPPLLSRKVYLPDYSPRTPAEVGSETMERLSMLNGSSNFLGKGWHNREFNGSRYAFRWTSKDAVAYLVPRRKAKYVRLEIVGAEPVSGTRGKIIINESQEHDFFVKNEKHELVFPVPRTQQTPIQVRIKAHNVFVPSKYGFLYDGRELGIAVSSISLEN